MRTALLVFAGCGRLAFDEQGVQRDAPSSGSDAAVPEAVDAAPICASPCTLADSLADWDNAQQGTQGWTYGYWWAETDTDATYDAATDFTPMIPIDGVYRPSDFDPATTSSSFTWCYLAQWGGHPGESPQKKYPVRRWTSSAPGLAAITLHVDKSDTSGGNGVSATLVVDGVTLWHGQIDSADGVGATVTRQGVLHAGSTVDYLLDPAGDDGSDTTNEQLTISGP